MVTKERWVAIMKAFGLDEAAMITWHQKFEEMEPDEHQIFLVSLGIDAEKNIKISSLCWPVIIRDEAVPRIAGIVCCL